MDQEKTPMENTGSKIMRKSIFTFLQNYQYFTSTPALLAFPFSASVLLANLLLLSSSSSSLLPVVYNRLNSLFHAAGLIHPPSSELFNLVTLKLSQTISFHILTLPFTLTFFLITKASVIQALKTNHQKPPSPNFFCIFSIFNPLLLTHVCNSLLILSANSTAFCLLFFTFNLFHDNIGFGLHLFLSAAGAVAYSIILAHAIIICNLALVLSGMERIGGYLAILKACVVIRGRASTALSLTVAVNIALAGVEALFQYRIGRAYHHHKGESETPSSNLLIISEGMLIVYLYSILVVLDTIVSCIFFKSCKPTYSTCIDQQSKYTYRINEIEEDVENGGYKMSLKV
ncbi:unnamed protein product [Dovyalis caffra]|uniref:Transmembrane protein n=1 Tax=Dovyalis caffra TaxID=77055 RepID=A0AAV1QRP3_9ROSI|nr:unnamed protein product [Dovyalis caffra]